MTSRTASSKPAQRSAPAPNRTERSAATRARIIAVAVRLFAERGIEGVSLNDINKAAGQRNKNATHYHFGSKEGLVQAILDKHEQKIARRREELLDEFEAAGNLNLRTILRALIQPMVEALDDPDGGPDFVRFSSHLVVAHTMAAVEHPPSYRIASVERIARALDAEFAPLPPTLKLQRGLLLGVALTHALAEHSRLRESAAATGLKVSTDIFAANLEDCLAAMLEAPPSDTTNALLKG